MEDECKIEYLEEDEEVVQQCVQTVPTIVKTESIQANESGSNLENLKALFDQVIEDQVESLLEIRNITERKRRKQDDDSDYDPSEDFEELETVRKRKKLAKKAPSKQQQIKKTPSKPQPVNNRVKLPAQSQNQPQSSSKNLVKTYENKLKSLPNLTVRQASTSSKRNSAKKYEDKLKSIPDLIVNVANSKKQNLELKNIPNLAAQVAKSSNQHETTPNKQNSVKTYENMLKSLPNLTVQKKKVQQNKKAANNHKKKHKFMGFEEVMLPEPDTTRVSQINVKRIQGNNLISRLKALQGLTCKAPTKR